MEAILFMLYMIGALGLFVFLFRSKTKRAKMMSWGLLIVFVVSPMISYAVAILASVIAGVGVLLFVTPLIAIVGFVVFIIGFIPFVKEKVKKAQ
ncbi:hypothetical protein [Geomicrobium sediminis]|uniref:Membrane-bound ClpP family serine protease n=1 Tax=Geomicrobium sediminis TaxID=1347788 RepID=A0ABS2PHS3_9BACL|nr:hypothetical protein [Geomicrobium sediminis]MBM7634886.1 membrane-bound ClpP family serine protease [Geomicrobium sediminis]